MPELRSSRPNRTSVPMSAVPARGEDPPEPPAVPAPGDGTAEPPWPALSCTCGDVREVVQDELEVIAFLDDGPQGLAGRCGVELGRAEEAERTRPVDCLGDPRRLG